MNNNYYAKLAKNKSLLKEYKTSESERSVYLEDGDEFQIQLFNPETTEISARIFIEDTQLSHDIVLRPGERLWLERYTDVSKKFKFITYIVDGENAQVKKAISHNGIIEIKFYRKRNNHYYQNTYPNITWINLNNNTYGVGDYVYTSKSIDNDYLNANYTSTAISSITTGSASTCTTSASNDSNITFTSATPINSNLDYTCFCSSISTVEPSSSSAIYNPELNKDTRGLETGRVSEGRRSNQKLETVYMDFEDWPFRTEKIKIYPLSRKPYNSNDLKKLYCPNCGRKLNSKYKFCPYCGEKID